LAELSDSFFRDSFKYFWQNFRKSKSNFRSIQQWWDIGKVKIRQFCQQYTRNVTMEFKKSMEILENELSECQKIAESTGTSNNFELFFKKKAQLADLLDYRTQGALVRSRFQNINHMDAPSKFFFCLEKKNGQKRLIKALQAEDGQFLLNPSDIRKRAVGFYKNLFRSEYEMEGETDGPFLSSLPKMSEEGNVALSGALSLGELCKALHDMESGKAPGIDGLPVDFYKSFWAELGADLLQVMSVSLSEGMLPLSCRRAVITLIPKKGDLTDIRNWRPVSLLCCDYKLLSKVLANRLAEVIRQVIHPDQSYCIPRRSIFDNISLVRDALEVSKLLDLDFGLISLDQEKAFDRVEHPYLWKTLAAFGFKKDFIMMVQVLYSDIESVLKVNGGLCAPFKVERGVRQGCSLSGMLYALAIEPLLQKIREKIDGLHLPNCTKKICLSAYADDVMVFVSGQKDVQSLFDVINDFTFISSAKVNWKKCETLLVGKWKDGNPKIPFLDELSLETFILYAFHELVW